MSLVAAFDLQIPNGAEVVAMTVEAHACSRLLFGTNRHQQFELQRLFQLAHRGQLAGSSEEWVAGRGYLMRGAEQLCQPLALEHPSGSKIQHLLGRPHANELTHAEG